VSPRVVPLTRGDTLIFSTDGVRPGFAGGVTLAESPQEIADRVIAAHAKETDDALVLVARYLGDH
jgi:negative regulator of sigma-B (phosphoserine phosphatase)